MSKGTSTPGPWEWMADPECAQDPTKMLVGGEPKTLLMSVMPPIPNAPAFEDFEANLRLIALASTMRDALLKVRRWRQVEHDLDEATVDGRPELADLMQECPKLESEIDAVIDQIEANDQ